MTDMSTRPLRARLHHLQVRSAEPERLAGFYRDTLDMALERQGDRWFCHGPDRRLVVTPGESRTLAAAGYAVESREVLEGLGERLTRADVPWRQDNDGLFAEGVAFADPDGNRIAFGIPHLKAVSPTGAAARLQHVVVGSPQAARLAAFHAEVVGFRVSDRVLTEERELSTCFLRSDQEHHSFAVFRTERARLDHHCYELADWNALRDWADRLAAREIAIEWGPGRHGPGNNLFLFFHDPDGNWLELSAELEKVAADRVAGEWPHAERTLNLWGRGLLRS